MSAIKADLAQIHTFPQLVTYLREELDWPISSDNFDDLLFDYSPEELGIDSKNAAKILEIKRLRPLSVNQPWGVFFVKFEPKRLPVVALKRILNSVVLKKRASANHSERAAWDAEDLLFISNYGDGDARQITFAHFSQDPARNDLPTLKVLGWDNLDTPLHIDRVAEELSEHLAWPKDEEDVDSWREAWQSAFTLRHREVITTSKELAVRLAELARAIRDRIRTALAIETEAGPLTKLLNAFREALVHDLDADGFADMYAQTIAYGLLSARIADPKSASDDGLAAHMLVTNPFLKELMATFMHVGGHRVKRSGPSLDFDELGVDEVVGLLDAANMEAIILDFGDRNPQEDPVIHFYELFLAEYDKKQKVSRGVFYTPRPVVSYIVRSVDELLRTGFGLADGLADTVTWGEMAKRHGDIKIPRGTSSDQDFVQILDPGTGTGTFLVEVIDLTYKTLVAKWEAEGSDRKQIDVLWNEYVPQHLLPRLHGYELLMAPYAIAHLKIGLKLYETGYRFDDPERARVYLTNSLEPAHDFAGQLETTIPALAHESQAVNAIKRTQVFTVIVGNPPYSARSYNLTASARAMVERYKSIDGVRIKEKGALQLEKNLNDDYVKFLCLSQILTEGHRAVVGLITNHSFLENPTLRGLRWNLLRQYSQIRLVDLGGNVARRETGEDDNVFDISQGVAISLFANSPSPTDIEIGRLRGTRADKYEALLGAAARPPTTFMKASPIEPLFLFRIEDVALRNEYYEGIPVTEFFPLNSTGVKTHRDSFCIDFELDPLRARIADLVATDLSDEDIREKYGLEDTHGWALTKCRRRLRLEPHWDQAFSRILYRPFDWRHIYFSPHVIELARMEVSSNFLNASNLGLVFMRQVAGDEPYSHFGVTRNPVDNRCFYSNRGTMSFAPLYVVSAGPSSDELLGTPRTSTLNLGTRALNLLHQTGAESDQQGGVESLFGYSYAVFHSPAYRQRYSPHLRVDFPRLPHPRDRKLFYDLARLGGELVSLHLMESQRLEVLRTTYAGPPNPSVARVGWSDDVVWLDAPARKQGVPSRPGTVGFQGVSESVWNFRFGGYQVCEKWLKDRKGRQLTSDDVVHYQKIVVALAETARVMEEIDEVIEEHGGWPGAFAS